jgi:hypothetical protein
MHRAATRFPRSEEQIDATQKIGLRIGSEIREKGWKWKKKAIQQFNISTNCTILCFATFGALET